MTPEQLQHRLDALERRQSRMFRLGGAAVLVFAAGALMAQTQLPPPRVPPGTESLPIKASRFELVDQRGDTRAVLSIESGAPFLELRDARGGTALKLLVEGADGSIEYSDGGQILNLMKPAPRVQPLTNR